MAAVPSSTAWDVDQPRGRPVSGSGHDRGSVREVVLEQGRVGWGEAGLDVGEHGRCFGTAAQADEEPDPVGQIHASSTPDVDRATVPG